MSRERLVNWWRVGKELLVSFSSKTFIWGGREVSRFYNQSTECVRLWRKGETLYGLTISWFECCHESDRGWLVHSWSISVVAYTDTVLELLNLFNIERFVQRARSQILSLAGFSISDLIWLPLRSRIGHTLTQYVHDISKSLVDVHLRLVTMGSPSKKSEEDTLTSSLGICIVRDKYHGIVANQSSSI